jgi:uncharacterized membrane protein
MNKNRLEAFSDGVIAVIITIMVLEMKVPHGIAFENLRELIPVFISYVLSYIYVGIYWNNHHHMFHAVHHVDGRSLWANLHLLFWLSLFPFVTGWVAENHFALYPVVLYGFVLLMAAIAYFILAHVLIRCPGQNADLARALGSDIKGKISPLIYVAGMALSFVHPWIGFTVYILVAVIWLVPDRRIEKTLGV